MFDLKSEFSSYVPCMIAINLLKTFTQSKSVHIFPCVLKKLSNQRQLRRSTVHHLDHVRVNSVYFIYYNGLFELSIQFKFSSIFETISS